MSETKNDQSYWAVVKKQFKKNRLAIWSVYIIFIIFAIAIFADFLANEKPIVVKYNGKIYFPVFKEYAVDLGVAKWSAEMLNADWKNMEFEWAVWPAVPYLPKNIDFSNAQSVGPFDKQHVKSKKWRHWLGTDELGRDVLAGTIHGTRIAVSVGIIAMSVASFIGILLGSLAGFFGDSRLRLSRATIIFNILFFCLALFYAFGNRSYTLADAIGKSFIAFFGQLIISLFLFIVVMIIGNLIARPLSHLPYLNKKIALPVDMLVMRLIETLISIPTLFLIISIIAIAKPSLFLVMAVIGLVSWTGIARFVRAEMLKVKNLEYIEAAKALGFSEFRIMFKHALPNAISPVLITISFGIAAAILTESALSFLGIGVPPEVITWGSLLSSARSSPSAWWLAVVPGTAIFITVTVYNLVGEGLTDAMDPRLRK